ncbi:MAG: hypothetical protein JSW55_11955 [Chloroflexota bacterium]|nr:MAG: hypothetical protein JSW55_11955 [Chloroflexota bacterium]
MIQKLLRHKLILVPLMLIVALVAALPAAAQSGQIGQATLSAPEGELTVGDPIAMTLSVTHPADHHVIAPELETSWGDFTVQNISAPQTTASDDGTVTTELVVDARLFAPGAFSTPPLAVKIADDAGQVVELIAQPLTVEIGSVLVEGDSELRDIKPQAELPYVNLIPWIVAGVILAGAALVIVLLVRRSRAKRALAAVDNRLPHEVALDELGRIEGLHLPDAARFKEHYSLISDCLRLYMERRFGVPMLERTTAEIDAELRETSLPQPMASQYVSLLDVSDLVKFSKFRPDASSAYDLLESARQIVIITKPAGELDAASGDSSEPGAASGPNLSNNGNYQQSEVRA